ncbi:MAG: hypothetical protein KME55_31495 [Nostoc indistinguendum CM1-VF10]|nr:hypothetical protein [Nostoc indistinguendum CM1-VF10]
MKTNFENESFEDERDNYQRGFDGHDIFAERVRSNQRKLSDPDDLQNRDRLRRTLPRSR